MAEIFRIETDCTSLSWSDRFHSAHDSTKADGRLAISLSNRSGKNVRIWRRGLSDGSSGNVDLQLGPRLFEETPYDVLLYSNERRQVQLRHRDPAILQALHSSAEGSIVHGPIDFEHEVGRSRFSVYLDGKVEYDFEVEVFPARLDYAADYDELLADTQDILNGVVLEYLRATVQFGFVTQAQIPSRLEWILSLRHVINDLERGLRYVEQHPHHNLVRERIPTRVEKLRHPDAAISKLVARGKGEGAKTRTASGLVLHSKLPERRSRPTWDTPEHRWLASQLSRIQRRLAELHRVERKRKAQDGLRQLRTTDEIAALEDRIAALRKLEPIAQASGLVPPGFTSLTLQTRPGYREAYRACLILLEGLRVDGGGVELSVKDTDCLYAYWCYLALARTIARITGEPVAVRELFLVERSGLRLRLKRGTSQTINFSNDDRSLELTYNSRYKDNVFLLPQKPDLVLSFHNRDRPALRLVFDTKYEINPEPNYVEQFGSPGPAPESIDVLHRYRDALLEQTGLQGSRSEILKRTAVEGVALFPYCDADGRFQSSRLWLSLQELGIGAIPFLPSETRYLEEWLRVVLQRHGWPVIGRKSPTLPPAELRAWQEAEKESVLIAALRRNATEHLDWIKATRSYFTSFARTRVRQQVPRWLAIYSPPAARRPDAITHLAEVVSFDLKNRREIDTPWSAPKVADDVQVVYQLGDVRKLERPIENAGPRHIENRFSGNRWTSRLALLRATNLQELSLETSAEWSLYEQLRHAGVQFWLKPAAARLPGEHDPRGRPWFIQKQLRVQYRGAAGFLLRRNGLRDEYVSDLQRVIDGFLHGQ